MGSCNLRTGFAGTGDRGELQSSKRQIRLEGAGRCYNRFPGCYNGRHGELEAAIQDATCPCVFYLFNVEMGIKRCCNHVVGTSGENEGSKKAKKKNKKKGNLCGFKSRFNSKRLAQIGSEFKHKNKSITFSKLMVKRIFNMPFGDRPMKLLKKSDEHDLRSIYKEGNRAPIAHVVKLLTSCSEEDVVMINRTWALLALATVLCPGTGNMVNLEYLASLEDMSLVHEFTWDEHLLARAMEEVGVFQEKKRMQANTEKEFQIASCLPMLAIIYMDCVDIPAGLPNEHAIDYSVPRICFVCQKDFEWLDKVDKNKLTLVQPFYGKHIHFMAAFLFPPLMFCFPRSGVCATPPMQHNLWGRKLVLKQLVGRELVLKHLILLKQDPTTFQPAKLIPELERVVTKFKANKYDLVTFFTIVHDKHWIIVCANLLYKQWNVFDSIHSKGKQSPLKKQANNLITNFAALAQEYSQFNVNVGSFACLDLEDYPKQDTLKTWRDTAWMWHTTSAFTQSTMPQWSGHSGKSWRLNLLEGSRRSSSFIFVRSRIMSEVVAF
ncbi:uncharacterized protein LOC119321364 [Triticum dicoccoides]|uniref:uncharacterized protein LOC119321364 n=1 Tax=Triticum dicoccoides TaxID=85692 RepID=UPI001891A91E|nr:uncharacterized protein LOC119321364 [Triticum dicoccoides]